VVVEEVVVGTALVWLLLMPLVVEVEWVATVLQALALEVSLMEETHRLQHLVQMIQLEEVEPLTTEEMLQEVLVETEHLQVLLDHP
tara:strand:- start:193 stop:450 length:258 start_codon:yes stop_codon:yes gene_type:complete